METLTLTKNQIEAIKDYSLFCYDKKKKVRRIERLIEEECDLCTLDYNKETPLQWAVMHSDYRLVCKLLKAGADVNRRDNDGWTPLKVGVLKAFSNVGKEIVKLLIRKGANINAQTSNGDTPLHAAVIFSNLEVISYLLEKGADAGIENYNGHTPYDIAVKKDRSHTFTPHLSLLFKNNK